MSVNDFFATINVLYVELCKVLWSKFIICLGRKSGEENANKLLLSSSSLPHYDILALLKKIN
jgi:hypothetical protein